MEVAYVALRLANDARADLEEINATALVDTGVPHLCIPEYIAGQLKVKDTGIREVILGDGNARQVRYVSPIRIDVFGRTCVTGALVFGDQVLLGGIPMDDMDLIVESAGRRLSVNPRNPNIPRSLAKGILPAKWDRLDVHARAVPFGMPHTNSTLKPIR